MKKAATILLFAFSFFGATVAASAETPQAKAKETKPYLRPQAEAPPKLARKEQAPLGRALLALSLVGALGGLALYTKRRRPGSPLLQNHVRLHTLGSVALGPKAKVALLSVGKEAILVGVSENGVSCLRSYKEDELGTLTTGPAKKEPEYQEETIDLGANTAFDELLLRASKDEALHNARAAIGDETGEATRPKTAAKDNDARPSSEDELPPHLRTLLEQSATPSPRRAGREKAPDTAGRHLRAVGAEAFGEPEGQAAELARRFAELQA